MKLKKQKFYAWGLMITMIAVYGFFPVAPNANAIDSISDAADLISDSDVDRVATHTFTFTTGSTTPQNGFWQITFPSGFTTVGAGTETCGYGDLTASTTNQVVDCVAGVGGQTGTTTSVVITGVTNPNSEGTQYIVINNYDDNGVIMERVKVAVVIIEDVLVTATVDSNIDFSVVGTTTPLLGLFDCADTNSQTPTATSVPFGVIDTNPVNLCQQLNVTTNAQDGFVVTVEQDHELLADSGANINSFDDAATGLGSTTPQIWNAPANTLDDYNTYGHLAISSNDDALIAGSGLSDFDIGGPQLFAGLNSTDVMTVMDHDGPSDGEAQNVGLTTVMYRIQIGSLQEAGDYESTLTYICTPTF